MVSISGLNSIFPKNKVFQDEIKGLGKNYSHLRVISREWKRL